MHKWVSKKNYKKKYSFYVSYWFFFLIQCVRSCSIIYTLHQWQKKKKSIVFQGQDLCGVISLSSLLTIWSFHLFFFNINLFIYLFLAALGLRCCARAFSICRERGLLFVVVCGLCSGFSCFGEQALGTCASVVVAHGFYSAGFSSCGARA